MAFRREPLHQKLVKSLPQAVQWKAAGALARLAGGDVTGLVNQATFKLDLREAIQRQLFLGTYEPEETTWFRECLEPGDIFVDVGANFGHYTTLGSKLVGPDGRVFAFEPSPTASHVLSEAIRDSGISNVLLTQAAVGRSAGETTLFMPNTPALHSPSLLASDPSFLPVRVQVLRLDDFAPLRGLSHIKLAKIDVEGYEPDVIEGMANLIQARKVENIFCELNSAWLQRNECTPQQLLNRLKDLGYTVHKATRVAENLVGDHGELYDLQDIWFTLGAFSRERNSPNS